MENKQNGALRIKINIRVHFYVFILAYMEMLWHFEFNSRLNKAGLFEYFCTTGSIPVATRFSEKYWVWNGIHSVM
jgi:hypothetical protein